LKKIIICILLIICASNAQIVVEEDVTTDSVDLFQTESTFTKSSGIAMGASILLPGLGHQYIGRSHRALTYFTADLLLLVGAIYTGNSSHKHFANARAFAWKYAGADSPAEPGDVYWKHIGYAIDKDSYNQIQLNNREPGKQYNDPKYDWHWMDESLMEKYNEKRELATTYQVASSFLIGAMLLNRVIAFIDVRAATKHKEYRTGAQVRFSPLFASDFSSAGLVLSKTF